MDSLEKRLLEALVEQYRVDFKDDETLDLLLSELKKPFQEICDSEIEWKSHVPKAFQNNWLELTMSARFTTCLFCRDIQSLESTVHSFWKSFQDSSRRTK